MKEKTTIVDIAAGDDSFSPLVAAPNTADLVSVPDGTGPFTVFAPTNEAFSNIPAKTLETFVTFPIYKKSPHGLFWFRQFEIPP
ncbi:MAG: hypothetical protein GYB20_01600 [Oceanospirillales bacterium]|nr:hypothetical protein [Oceanospirillales bacterium]MBR9886386.1 hypothetical protein [Oceanospirillales bacterium]